MFNFLQTVEALPTTDLPEHLLSRSTVSPAIPIDREPQSNLWKVELDHWPSSQPILPDEVVQMLLDRAENALIWLDSARVSILEAEAVLT